jgi:FixJ family two-component response regulator
MDVLKNGKGICMSDFDLVIIEDNEAHAFLLKKTLAQVYPSVTVFDTAFGFFEQYQPPRATVVISDYLLPGMSGRDLLKKVKSGGLPVEILIASSDENLKSAVDFMREGAHFYFVKPIDTNKLLDLLPAAIARAQTASAEYQRVKSMEDRIATLTPAQAESVWHVLSVDTQAQAASAQGIGLPTLKQHWQTATDKLALQGIAERYLCYTILSNRFGLHPSHANLELTHA